MSELHGKIDAVVREGIQAYIGLLCCGERDRSRRLFSDVLQISSFAAGGPSARLPVSLGEDRRGTRSCTGGCDHTGRCRGTATGACDHSGCDRTAGATALARCMIYFTLRSVLASLLVLRATAYWTKVPALVRLHLACAGLSRSLGESSFGVGPDEATAIPVRT